MSRQLPELLLHKDLKRNGIWPYRLCLIKACSAGRVRISLQAIYIYPDFA
jgi:hypothetical protein